MAVSQFLTTKDAYGNATLIPVLPEWVDHLEYAAASSKNITVPTGARYCIIGINNAAAYAIKLGTGAAIAATDVLDGTASFLRLESFAIPRDYTGQVSIATDGAAKITLAWYKHQ